MRRFYIIVNSEKSHADEAAKQIDSYLAQNGAVCRFAGGVIENGRYHLKLSDMPDDTDCIITLGGDGTLIQAARESAKNKIPIIGINMGNIGYLTEIGKADNIRELLHALLEDSFEIEERMMLEGRIFRNGREHEPGIALNDIIVREGECRILKLRIYVDGHFLNEYRVDGMIVATPTGSTAYNLSAGGPIAQPDGRLLILTPICPHTLTSRTIVFGAESRIQIEIAGVTQGKAMAIFDGDTREELCVGDRIEILKSDIVTRVVKLNHRSFLDILKQKMAGI